MPGHSNRYPWHWRVRFQHHCRGRMSECLNQSKVVVNHVRKRSKQTVTWWDNPRLGRFTLGAEWTRRSATCTRCRLELLLQMGSFMTSLQFSTITYPLGANQRSLIASNQARLDKDIQIQWASSFTLGLAQELVSISYLKVIPTKVRLNPVLNRRLSEISSHSFH